MSKSYWVIGADGQSYGPADEQMLAQWAREGRLVAGSTLQDVATNQRVQASQVPAVAAALAPAGPQGEAAGGRPAYAPQTFAPQTVMFERSAGYSPATIVGERAAERPAGYSPATIVSEVPAGGYQPREAGYAPQTVAFQQPAGYQQSAGYQQQAQTAAALPGMRPRPMSQARANGPAAGGGGYAGESPRTVMFEQTPAGYADPAGYPAPAGYGGYPQQPAAQPQQPIAYANPYSFNQNANAHTLTRFSPAVVFLLGIVTFGLFPMVHFMLMHGKMPKNRPDDPGAGKAIGFHFIPVFGVYWLFFSNLRLFERVNEQRRFAGLPEANLKGLWLTGLCVMLVPLLGWVAGPIILIVQMFTLQGSVNELVRATRGPNA